MAACWFGGAVSVARELAAAARRREPDQLAYWHLGETDLDLLVARAALAEAAEDVDAGRACGPDGERLAVRVRSVVAAAAERILTRVGHALGPAPLTLDERHPRRVADLTVYLRQHHAERDLAALGRSLVAAGGCRAGPGDEGLPWAPAVVLTPDGGLRRRKAAALAAHRSQVEPLSALPRDEPLLGPHVLAHFVRDTETFFADVPDASDVLLPHVRAELLDGGGR